MNSRPLILASSSRYRAVQLKQLGLSFEAMAPEVDERAIPDETPAAQALRLAETKAEAILQQRPEALVIAGDQTAVCADILLQKPGCRERAIAQLETMQGRESSFFSAFCLRTAEQSYAHVCETVVKMRALTAKEIARYIEAEQPLDCAGSFKIESLGICLFDWVRSDDPSALTGLPLLELSKGLRSFGLQLP